MKEENDNYIVEFVQQNEVNDIWKITRKIDGLIWYDSTEREYYNSAADILESAELYGYLND